MNFQLSRRHLLAGLGIAGGVGLVGCSDLSVDEDAATSGGASGEVKVGEKELKFAFAQPLTHPQAKAMQFFSDNLYDATEGRYSVQINPNESLGSQAEVIQLLQDGSIDMATAAGGLLVNFNPDFAVLNLPYAFKSGAHQIQASNDQDIVGDLYATTEAERFVVVAAWFQGVRSLYNRNGPIVTPADMAGMKFRVPENEIDVAMIAAMGGVGSPMAFGEIYTALQSGVIDGAENSPVVYGQQKHFEVAPFFSNTKHTIPPDYVLAGEHVFKGMSEEDVEIFKVEMLKANDKELELFEADIEEQIKVTTEGGAAYNDVDDEAFAEILEAFSQSKLTDSTRPLWDAFQASSPS